MGRANRNKKVLRFADHNAQQGVAQMSNNKQSSLSGRNGFTLVEVMIASAISTLVVFGLFAFFISTYTYWHGVNMRMEADSDANIAMSRMVYGMGDRLGLRNAKEASKTDDGKGGWTLNYVTGGDEPQANSFTYSKKNLSLVFNPGNKVAGRDISKALATVDGNTKAVTLELCVEKKENGKLKASREIDTKISFRNTKN